MGATASSTGPHVAGPAFVPVCGLRTAYRRAGTGAPTVFLHGAGMTRVWLPFHRALAEAVDLIAPEHPGMGDTAAPARPAAMDDVVLHYRHFLDTLDLPSVHLVGHSLGGWIAAELAVWFPERIRSLTLITPVGLRVAGHPYRDLAAAAASERMDMLFSGDAARWLDALPAPRDHGERQRAAAEAVTLAHLGWARRYDPALERRLRWVDVPATAISVADDWLVPPAYGARYAELLPRGRHVELPRGSHMVPVTEPGLLARTVLDAVRGRAR